MARRRTRNYRELREEYDAAERKESDEELEEEEADEEEDEEEEDEEEEDEEEIEAESDEEEEEAPVKKKKKAKEKAPKPKRSRSGKTVPMKMMWAVFNNSNQPIATFEWKQKEEAEAHAARLHAEKKQTYFVQPIKQPM